MFANPHSLARAQIERTVRLAIRDMWQGALPTGPLEEVLRLDAKIEEHLGADSLDVADIIMEVEDRLEIDCEEDEQAIKTVGDLVTHAEKAVRAKEA